jgi:hypothetical protein
VAAEANALLTDVHGAEQKWVSLNARREMFETEVAYFSEFRMLGSVLIVML